jgi:hypothetical protein
LHLCYHLSKMPNIRPWQWVMATFMRTQAIDWAHAEPKTKHSRIYLCQVETWNRKSKQRWIIKVYSILKMVPVRTAQPAAAASAMLWPANPGRNDPPTTAMGESLYRSLSSPVMQIIYLS